jgi:hypothetical protein
VIRDLAGSETMIYILLDTDSGNYEGTFQTESDALAEVRDAVVRFGRSWASLWALAVRQPDGCLRPMIEGDALIDLAFGRASVQNNA